ncbi:hypothetical protein ACFL6I_07415 [candidate division KSB1 bacterium]
MSENSYFPGSREYWEARYAGHGSSGAGSYGKLAGFKAGIVNKFVRDNNIRSVIEFGCGDGNQLLLASYPEYIGLEVSNIALNKCKKHFENDTAKRFFFYDPEHFDRMLFTLRAELALSLDVIFHLIEDHLFELYMSHLFGVADRFVIIYSSDTDINPPGTAVHFKNRKFSDWITARLPEWKLLQKIPNRYPYDPATGEGSVADFYIYGK